MPNLEPTNHSIAITAPDAVRTAARSGLYSLLARALVTPTPVIYEYITNGGLGDAVRETVRALPYPLAAPEFPPAGPDFVAFQSGFISAFEVGVKGPPCPLYEGAFRQDRGRKAVMEEVLRFYHFFELHMSDAVRELPDQLSAELEFMHYLAFREADLIEREGENGEGRDGLSRGQRDFIERHLLPWVPALQVKAQKIGAPGVFVTLLGLLADFARADHHYLSQLTG